MTVFLKRYWPKLRLAETVLMALISTVIAAPLAAMELSSQIIKLEHPANGDLIKLAQNPYLLVSGHNSEHRWLSLVDLTRQQAEQVPIPVNAQFFQAARLKGLPGEQLVVLSTDGIWHYQLDSKRWRQLLASSSLYRVVDSKRLRLLPISVDLNNDQLSDFLIPDFNGYQLQLQQADGSFQHFSLAVDSQMQIYDESPNYVAKTPYLADLTGDGLTDIAFAIDDNLLVFAQQAAGGFTAQGQLTPLGLGLTPDIQAQQRSGDGRSFENLKISRLERLMDINADGLVDIVVQRQHYVDVMEQNSSYRIHYGQRAADGRVVFKPEPDQSIDTRGVQFDVRFVDLDADKRLDFYTPAAEVGLGTIVRALLAGTAEVDMLFYKQQPDGSFGSKPSYQQDVTVEIALGSGQINMPLATVVKNAAGKASLLLADGKETLRSFGPVGAKLFSDKSTKQKFSLPKRGSQALVVDLNDDGKEDLVLPFSNQEHKADSTNQLQILLQQ